LQALNDQGEKLHQNLQLNPFLGATDTMLEKLAATTSSKLQMAQD